MALVGLAAGVVSVGAPGMPSSADPIGPARANAVALSQRVLEEAELVHDRTVQYQVDSARADLVREELAGSEATAQALRSRAAQTESLLRQEALLSYADALPVVGAGGQSPGDLVEVTDQTTYLALTVGDISGTLKLLQTEQSQLAGTVAASRRDLESALEAESSAGAARQLALREAGSLQVLLARAQSQVAALTAAERPRTGPPVGDGIVKAVAQQLGTPPAAALPKAVAGPPLRAARAASTTQKGATAFKADPARTVVQARTIVPAEAAGALSKAPGTRATTTPDLATTTAPRTTTTRGPITAGRPSTTATGPRPTTTTTTTTAQDSAVAPAARNATPSSTTTSSVASSTTTTAPSATAPSATAPSPTTTSSTAPATTTTTAPPPPPTAPPATTPPATTPPATTATTADLHPPPAGGLWLELRDCESGDNYQEDTGNGYYGAYQFSWPTWVDLGYPGRPDLEPYWMQDQAAQRLEGMDGWSQWPSCSAALGV
jgi:hypothetical protein